MFSFRTILLAAAAFATVATAIPTPDTVARDVGGPLGSVTDLASGGGVAGLASGGVPAARGEHDYDYYKHHKYHIADSFDKCHKGVKVVTEKISELYYFVDGQLF